MTVLEKRKVERSNNILIVSFRQFRASHEYLSGITNNYSIQGISLETGRFAYNPGEVLELILQHPYSELSVEVVGEIVWKIDGWYKNIMGIKLKGMDQEADNKMKDLMTTVRVHVDSSLPHNDVEPPEEMGDMEIVDDGTAAKAEIIMPQENVSSISKEEVELPSPEKAEINIPQHGKDKTPSKIINTIGLLLIAFYVFFTIVTVATRLMSSENEEKPQLSGSSQNTTAVQGLPAKKGNTGPYSYQYFIGPIPEAGITSEHVENVEKPNPSQNTASPGQQPLLREEIIFDLDSDVISPIYRLEIDKFVKPLLSGPDAMLKIEGYADSIGEELYNLDLAMRRAWEVKKLLISRGINDKRIKVTVYGESYPASSNNDESENPKDRRVTLLLVPSGKRI